MIVKNPKSVHTSITDVNNLLVPLQTNISASQNNITTLQSSVSSVQTNVMNLQSNVASIQNTVNSNLANIANLQSTVSSLATIKAFVAWSFTGTTLTIRNSFNVTSMVRSAIGIYTVTFTSAISPYAPLSVNSVDPLGKLSVISLAQTSTTVNLVVAIAGKITPSDCNGSLVAFG